jgi:hypothetical protein
VLWLLPLLCVGIHGYKSEFWMVWGELRKKGPGEVQLSAGRAVTTHQTKLSQQNKQGKKR